MTRALHMARFLLLPLVTGVFASRALAEASLNTWVVKGVKALERSQEEEALRCFESAHRENPYSHEIECYVGLGHFKAGNYARALEHFKRAVNGDPTLVDSAFLFYSASCYRALGLVSLEREAWEHVREWDPDSRFAETARKALSEPARETPSMAALMSSGRRLFDAGHPYAAAAHFAEGRRQPANPLTPDASIYLALALNETGQYDEVLRLEDRVPDTHDDLWRFARAYAFMMKDDHERALNELNAIPRTDELAARADKLKILCSIRAGQQDKGTEDMRRLVSADGAEHLDVFRRLLEQVAVTAPGD